MLNDSGVQVFPALVRSENGGFSQKWTVYRLNTRPSHEFTRCEAFHQITVDEVNFVSDERPGRRLTNAVLI